MKALIIFNIIMVVLFLSLLAMGQGVLTIKQGLHRATGITDR